MNKIAPDALRLVPVEPTEAMLAAGQAAGDYGDALKKAYRAMLAASPAVQPAAGREEALRKAAQRMADDYQVSSNHHPHHVLVQRKDFDDLCQALAAISTPAQASESGSALDPVLFDHAWKMVQAIRGGGTPPFLTPTEAADKAATYLLSRLDERNALSAPQAAPGD